MTLVVVQCALSLKFTISAVFVILDFICYCNFASDRVGRLWPDVGFLWFQESMVNG